jgi:hypothetical protein
MCDICCEDGAGLLSFAMGCGHRYCVNCYRQYLSPKIEEEGEAARIKCPQDGCDRTMHAKWLDQIVTSEGSSSDTPASRTDSEKGQPESKAPLRTNNELGIEEPPPTPATAEKMSLTTEKTTAEVPAETPAVDSKAILDLTLPQNRPDKSTSESASEEQKPAPRI